MKNIARNISLLCLILLGATACTSATTTDHKSIKYNWQLLQVIYDDGSINRLGQGNYVLIEDSEILEVIGQRSKRRYPYIRKNSVLYITSGEAIVEWEIVSLNENNLQLKTPIGVYILKR